MSITPSKHSIPAYFIQIYRNMGIAVSNVRSSLHKYQRLLHKIVSFILEYSIVCLQCTQWTILTVHCYYLYIMCLFRNKVIDKECFLNNSHLPLFELECNPLYLLIWFKTPSLVTIKKIVISLKSIVCCWAKTNICQIQCATPPHRKDWNFEGGGVLKDQT